LIIFFKEHHKNFVYKKFFISKDTLNLIKKVVYATLFDSICFSLLTGRPAADEIRKYRRQTGLKS